MSVLAGDPTIRWSNPPASVGSGLGVTDYDFATSFYEASGIPKNTKLVETVLDDGTVVRTIPDGLGKKAGGVLEIKAGEYLTMSDQLRGQMDHASKTRKTFNLAVGPDTVVARPVIEAVGGLSKMPRQIYRFDPKTSTLIPLR